MIPLAIGLGILGFVAMRRAHRRCHGWMGHGYYAHWSHRGPGRHMLYQVFQRLDASPAQERAIVAEVDKLRERVREAKFGLRDARGDLAAALRNPTLDDAALGAMLGKVDGASANVRAAVLEALRNIHGVLDDGQRAELAELLEHAGGFGGFGPRRGPWGHHHHGWAHGGPYRM